MIGPLDEDEIALELARHRLSAALSTPSPWNTNMDEAPRDGTRFWAYEAQEDGCSQYECWWQEDFTEWTGWQNDWDTDPKPTAWMPLAPPPQEAKHD